jgi:hypothetical protein
MKELIGKTITKILATDYVITFECKKRGGGANMVSYEAHGDCCSESYFSEILFNPGLEEKLKNGPMSLKVVNVVDLELQEGDYRPLPSRQEYDEVYGVKILVECPGDEPDSITIIHRNSSNGYYGGWCSPTDRHLFEIESKVVNQNHYSD